MPFEYYVGAVYIVHMTVSNDILTQPLTRYMS